MQFEPIARRLELGFTPYACSWVGSGCSADFTDNSTNLSHYYSPSLKAIAIGSRVLKPSGKQVGAAAIVSLVESGAADAPPIGEVSELNLPPDEPGWKCVTPVGLGAAIGDFSGGVFVIDVDRLQSNSSSADVWRAKKSDSALINAIDACGGKTLYLDGGSLLGENTGMQQDSAQAFPRIREEPQPGAVRELVTGSKDGLVRVWDLRVPEYVCEFGPFISSSPSSVGSGGVAEDCWAVAFGGAVGVEERVVAAGFDSGMVRLFDLRKASSATTATRKAEGLRSRTPGEAGGRGEEAIVWSTSVGYGVCSLEFDSQTGPLGRLAVAMLEARFRVYDFGSILPPSSSPSAAKQHVRTQSGTAESTALAAALAEREPPFVQRMAHDSTVWSLRHSPFHRDIWATAGGDGGLRFWDYKRPRGKAAAGAVGLVNERLRTKVHTQPALSVDWHRGFDGLCCYTLLDQGFGIGIAHPMTDPDGAQR